MHALQRNVGAVGKSTGVIQDATFVADYKPSQQICREKSQ
jgi:hypothetical protein